MHNFDKDIYLFKQTHIICVYLNKQTHIILFVYLNYKRNEYIFRFCGMNKITIFYKTFPNMPKYASSIFGHSLYLNNQHVKSTYLNISPTGTWYILHKINNDSEFHQCNILNFAIIIAPISRKNNKRVLLLTMSFLSIIY